MKKILVGILAIQSISCIYGIDGEEQKNFLNILQQKFIPKFQKFDDLWIKTKKVDSNFMRAYQSIKDLLISEDSTEAKNLLQLLENQKKCIESHKNVPIKMMQKSNLFDGGTSVQTPEEAGTVVHKILAIFGGDIWIQSMQKAKNLEDKILANYDNIYQSLKKILPQHKNVADALYKISQTKNMKEFFKKEKESISLYKELSDERNKIVPFICESKETMSQIMQTQFNAQQPSLMQAHQQDSIAQDRNMLLAQAHQDYHRDIVLTNEEKIKNGIDSIMQNIEFYKQNCEQRREEFDHECIRFTQDYPVESNTENCSHRAQRLSVVQGCLSCIDERISLFANFTKYLESPYPCLEELDDDRQQGNEFIQQFKKNKLNLHIANLALVKCDRANCKKDTYNKNFKKLKKFAKNDQSLIESLTQLQKLRDLVSQQKISDQVFEQESVHPAYLDGDLW